MAERASPFPTRRGAIVLSYACHPEERSAKDPAACTHEKQLCRGDSRIARHQYATSSTWAGHAPPLQNRSMILYRACHPEEHSDEGSFARSAFPSAVGFFVKQGLAVHHTHIRLYLNLKQAHRLTVLIQQTAAEQADFAAAGVCIRHSGAVAQARHVGVNECR